MSKSLESLLEHLTPAQAAKLMVTVSDVQRAARSEFGFDVDVDTVAGLIQCREAVFHGPLDEFHLSNALHTLRENPVVSQQLAQAEGLEEAKKSGADPEAAKFDGETLMQIASPSRRMALARRYDVGTIPAADRGQRRENTQTTAREYDTTAETKEDALRRLNKARGL